MSGVSRRLLAVLAIAGATWFLALYALPRVIMRVAMSRIRENGVVEARAVARDGAPVPTAVAAKIVEREGWNVPLVAPPTTSDSRTIVRPSPDLLYVACVFDLSGGPLLVRAPHSPTYLSLSAFSDATDNFVALNDRGPEAANGVALLLVPPGDRSEAPAGADGAVRVESPSLRGIVLARLRVDHPASLVGLVGLQKQVTCEPMRARGAAG